MSPAYKRWYDHDQKLLEVIELLKNYQDELKDHAVVFLDKLEQKVSKEALDRFYNLVKPVNGTRWYDQDPVISKTVEIRNEDTIQNISLEEFNKNSKMIKSKKDKNEKKQVVQQ